MTTLITDGFESETPEPVEIYNILYGDNGWTDTLDDATLGTLLEVRAIVLDSIKTFTKFEVRIYVSVEGRVV